MLYQLIVIILIFIIVGYILWIKYQSKNKKIEIENFLNTNRQKQFKINRNKPIIWIYHELEKPNSRKWDSFGSQLDLGNTPSYIWLCIYSVYVNCFKDFNIIILNSNTIYQYLPHLNIKIGPYSTISLDKRKEYISCCLLEKYGGIYLEPSIIIMKNLYPLYQNYIISQNYDFVGFSYGNDYIIGGIRENQQLKPSMKVMMSSKNTLLMRYCKKELHQLITSFNKTSYQFNQYQLCVLWTQLNKLKNQEKYMILSPSYNGTRDKQNKLITIDNFLSKNKTELLNQDDLYLVILPEEPLYQNIKYNWFIRYSISQIIESNLWIKDLFTQSLNLENKYNYTPPVDKVCSYHLQENCNCGIDFGRLKCHQPKYFYDKIIQLNEYEPISQYNMPPINEKELRNMLYQCNYFSTPPWLQVYNNSTPNV